MAENSCQIIEIVGYCGRSGRKIYFEKGKGNKEYVYHELGQR
jgi:hypothetical protein